jgi:hypothetical protein
MESDAPGVGVNRIEEWMQEAARVLSYEQAVAVFFVLEEGEEELTFGLTCKRAGNKWGVRLGWPLSPDHSFKSPAIAV